MAQHYDFVIRGGRYFDGTGAPATDSDVAVKDGRVAAVGPALDADAADRVIDAHGKWVLPGFLDTHTHYDAELLVAPQQRCGKPGYARRGR